MKHGKWEIFYNPKPGPSRSHDFDFVHDDYDGAPIDWDTASNDPRCGTASSIEDALARIAEIEAGDNDNDQLRWEHEMGVS